MGPLLPLRRYAPTKRPVPFIAQGPELALDGPACLQRDVYKFRKSKTDLTFCTLNSSYRCCLFSMSTNSRAQCHLQEPGGLKYHYNQRDFSHLKNRIFLVFESLCVKLLCWGGGGYLTGLSCRFCQIATSYKVVEFQNNS